MRPETHEVRSKIVTVSEPRFCPWEGQTLPTTHDCVGSPPACPTEEGHPCGVCASCLAQQVEDLARHGSPSDSDAP